MNLLLALVSFQSLGLLLLQIVIAGVLFWLLNWLIDYTKLPEPFATIARVLIDIAVVVWLINCVLSISGDGFWAW